MGSKRSVPLWCCRREEYRPINHSCYARAQLSIVSHSREYYHDGLCSSRFYFCLFAHFFGLISASSPVDRRATAKHEGFANVVNAIPFVCIGGALLWHFYWSYMGKHILGAVLELGSKRNLGAYYTYGLCCSCAFLLFKASACASLLSHLHAFGLLNCADDLLWSELFSWRYA